jgi:RNA polymerase sigma-70 factor (ECF subfamily)
MNNVPSRDDEELIRRAARGDAQGFAELYQQRRVDVFQFVLHMTGSRTAAEDITQEVFLTLINKLSSYDPARGTFLAYLFGITRKHLLRHFERGRPDYPLDEAGDLTAWTPDFLIERDDPLVNLTRDELISAVRQAVLSLPSRYREAVVLCEFQEMSYEKAAEAAGCAVGTIRSRLYRARLLLLDKLKLSKREERPPVRKPKGCLA